ncbi:MAG TPA: hypothetical protein VFB04_16405 [Terriglobales bacterium]|nr:hypothetical protein [Terriglobales bacterium]
MKTSARRVCQLLGLLLLTSLSLPLLTFAQDDSVDQQEAAQPSKPMYTVLPGKVRTDVPLPPAPNLPTWNGSFTYGGHNYTYNMVGTSPSSNSSTTITTYIIPVKIVITSGGSQYTYDPQHVLSNGKTVVQNTTSSPLFQNLTYVQGGVNVGTTQYEDAYQRANFWGTVQNAQSYHVLLSPTVLAEQTLSPSSRYGKRGSEFGVTAALVDINWFDAQLPSIMSRLGITPNTLPIFLLYDTYLTQNGQCCIGGYHSSEGNIGNLQSYAEATYVDHAGAFSQDVSALSHELGEWMDDPLTVNYNGNNTPCGILENGDPLEGNSNYGGYHYTLNGFQYNLQDLVTLPYFGAPANTSVNDWFTFQGESLRVCQNGS